MLEFKDPCIDLSDLYNQLKRVNVKLWDIEDQLRAKESMTQFNEKFIELARSVYIQNNLRASIKKEIKAQHLIEEKLH